MLRDRAGHLRPAGQQPRDVRLLCLCFCSPTGGTARCFVRAAHTGPDRPPSEAEVGGGGENRGVKAERGGGTSHNKTRCSETGEPHWIYLPPRRMPMFRPCIGKAAFGHPHPDPRTRAAQGRASRDEPGRESQEPPPCQEGQMQMVDVVAAGRLRMRAGGVLGGEEALSSSIEDLYML